MTAPAIENRPRPTFEEVTERRREKLASLIDQVNGDPLLCRLREVIEEHSREQGLSDAERAELAAEMNETLDQLYLIRLEIEASEAILPAWQQLRGKIPHYVLTVVLEALEGDVEHRRWEP